MPRGPEARENTTLSMTERHFVWAVGVVMATMGPKVGGASKARQFPR